jgi:hypothetical protein
VKHIATTVRCVPRVGYDNTEVRTIDLPLNEDAEDGELRQALDIWFLSHGIGDAVYDVRFDDDGVIAVINDEAYDARWGTPLL